MLENGDEINLLPYGIQKEFRTKCLIGNGVVIDPKTLLNDFHSLERNGIEYKHKTLLSQRYTTKTLLPQLTIILVDAT